MTGMLGVYLTAAELIRRGFIVSPTSRSAMGADLLVTDQSCKKAWSVQVKTNAKRHGFWLAGKHARTLHSASHVYIFVDVEPKKGAPPDFYVVPSKIVARDATGPQKWSGSFSYILDRHYHNKWRIFGDPQGPKPSKGVA